MPGRMEGRGWERKAQEINKEMFSLLDEGAKLRKENETLLKKLGWQ